MKELRETIRKIAKEEEKQGVVERILNNYLLGFCLKLPGFGSTVGSKFCLKKKKPTHLSGFLFSGPTWARTRDQMIMSHLL